MTEPIQGGVQRSHRGLALATALWSLGAAPALAQTDEIQVYNAEIASPGEFALTWHNNYAAIGRKQADFPGGVRPDGALNGVTEFSYGVTDWFELGAYVPFVYTLTRNDQFLLDAVKLRALVATPHAKERTFFYGLNFELSYNAKHWEPERVGTEFRPIIGLHLGPWELIFNPILDVPVGRHISPDFAPAGRVAYNLSNNWAVGVEHYGDLGTLSNLQPLGRQAHTTYAVVDYAADPYDIEFGVGHGFTAASDALVLKLLLTRSF
jgi:hypothetical protein